MLQESEENINHLSQGHFRCSRARNILAYIDAREDLEYFSAMGTHIANCSYCKRIYMQMKKDIQIISRKIPVTPIPPDFTAGINKYLSNAMLKLKEREVKDLSLRLKDYSRGAGDAMADVFVALFSIRMAMFFVAVLMAVVISKLLFY